MNDDRKEILTFKDVVRSYNGQRGVDRLSFQVDSGTVNLIIGGNGAGKSTLLALAAGLLSPDSGTITKTARSVSMVGHDPMLYSSLTVAENVGLALDLRGIKRSTEEVLQLWGLASRRSFPCSALSRGLRFRVSLATMFAAESDLLLLDEPLSSLDQEGRAVFIDCLKERCSAGATALIVSHDLVNLCSLSNRVMILHRGRLVNIIDAREGEPGVDPQQASALYSDAVAS